MEKIMCSICTESLFDIDHIVSTSCCHVFHEKCINQWTAKSQSCPECRKACSTESNRRLFFNSEPVPDYVEKEAFQRQIIELKNEMQTQKKSLEEALCCEMEIRREMHKENKKLKDQLKALQKTRFDPVGPVNEKDPKNEKTFQIDEAIIELLDSPTPPPTD